MSSNLGIALGHIGFAVTGLAAANLLRQFEYRPTLSVQSTCFRKVSTKNQGILPDNAIVTSVAGRNCQWFGRNLNQLVIGTMRWLAEVNFPTFGVDFVATVRSVPFR